VLGCAGMAPPRLWLSFLLGMAVVAGCPRRFDPRASEIHSNNPEAEADYRSAHRKWQEGDVAGAAEAFKLFLDKHSGNPSEPLLALARFQLGLCEYRRGDFDEARRLLAPYSAQIVEGEDATELHAVLADLYGRADQPGEALHEYELFYRSPHVRPLEQVYIRTQVAPLLSRLPAAEQRSLRSRFGIESPAMSPSSDSRRVIVGLALPLSGKDRPLGERVLRGALWGAQMLGPRREAASIVDLRVRDSSGAGAAAAVAELQREGAQAIVGSPVRTEAATLAAEAERRGLVALHLTTVAATAGSSGRSFQLLRSNEARAESLAQHLSTAGPDSVAVLAPATTYGQTMTRAFIAALGNAAPSVKVVAQLTFAPNATTFTAQARQILDLRPQAVFVPAAAGQLELIAAQLAAVGALATYRVERRESEPPVRLLLSSAEGMGERLLKNAGRYLQGAVLAPIATGGAGGSDQGRFQGYAQDGGGEPGALDALGYDAVQLVRAAWSAACNSASEPAIDAGCTTDQLSAGLRKGSLEGATGPIGFDAAGQRSGPAWLFRVDGDALKPLDGRARR